MPPPPRPIVGNVIKITTVARQLGQAGLMTGHVVVIGTTGIGATLLDIAHGALVDYQAVFPAIHTAKATLNGVLAELLSATTGRVSQSVVQIDNVTVGAVLGTPVPTQVAALVRKNTGFAGRGFRGRVFIPFLGSAWLTAVGELDPAQFPVMVGSINTVFGPDSYGAGPDTSQVLPVLLHKQAAPAPPSYALLDSVTPYVASSKLATQRRRGDYGRLNVPIG